MADQSIVKVAKPGVTGTKSLVIPITNIYDGSDYSAKLFVGSNKVPVNVILDTGSSTLAVTPKAYHAASDTDLKATTLAQMVMYGTGGWIGPVVNTTLGMGEGTDQVTLSGAPIAITYAQQKNNFTGVDGIMGLAYGQLNGAADLKDYLTKTRPAEPVTYPWPFPGGHFTIFANKYAQLIRSLNLTATDIQPYFQELEENGVVANKFAFYTKRSWVNIASTDSREIEKDPLNQGFFVLGGGEEQTHLYKGEFLDIDVQHDFYYNTNLVAVQVDGSTRVNALPLQPKYQAFMITNSIIDSGTSDLTLAQDVYNAIMDSLKQLNPSFATQISAATQTGVAMTDGDLSKWPNINFIFSGLTGNEVTLTCTPQTYWQTNFPKPGTASFQISGPMQGDDSNRSILGLPLMNNYYTIFDRSTNQNGIIRFAAIN